MNCNIIVYIFLDIETWTNKIDHNNKSHNNKPFLTQIQEYRMMQSEEKQLQ